MHKVVSIAAVTVLVLGPALAVADDVYLKGAGTISGRIVLQTETSVEVDIGAGRVTVPMSRVVRIEKRRSALDEYDDRAAALGPRDRAGWLALAQWASSQGLGGQARKAYERVLAIAPSDPDANRALGYVELDGRWVTEDEAYRARGYVKFEGEWITPAEHEAILRERAAEAAEERARSESEARVRDAEARALEAEARAAEAEARAAVQQPIGIPLWSGWGPGPIVWPPLPVIVPPVYHPTPVPRQVPR
jgi:hypothetical protein